MQLVQTNNKWNYQGRWMPAGEYVLENAGAAVCLSQSPGCSVSTMRPSLFLGSMVQDGESILITRPGAFGDLLFLTPTIRELKRRYPLSMLAVCAAPHFAQILGPGVTILPYPLTEQQHEKFSRHLWCENAIENNPRAKKIHAIDCFAELAGVNLTDRMPEYPISDAEMAGALTNFPSNGRKRVAIQVKASGLNRSYHQNLLYSVITGLVGHGYEIFLMGAPGDYRWTADMAHVFDISQRGLTIRESIAVMAACDLAICPDSVLLIAAQILNVPAIGLFGPFPSALRTIPGADVTALEGAGDCAPCFHHATSQYDLFPAKRPCSKTGSCTVLDSVSPENVIDAALTILRRDS